MLQGMLTFSRYLWMFSVLQSPNLADAYHEFKITALSSCLLKDNLIKSIAGLSLTDCVAECMTRTICKALNYDARLHLCGLFSDGAYVSDTKSCTLISKTDMTIPENIQDAGCNDGQKYDISKQICEYTECPTMDLLNGTIRGNMIGIGSRVLFICDSLFYEMNSQSSAICQEDGSWSYNPVCIQGIEYIGCVRDGRNRVLKDFHIIDDQMTLDWCFYICADYVYAMAQSTDECLCGDELTYLTPTSESECNYPCIGDSSQICGGYWRGNLYKIIK